MHHPGYAELQLPAASTSLEHLIAVFVKNHGVPTLIEPKAFKGHLSRTQELSKEIAAGLKGGELAAVKRILNKLSRLNEGSFYDKLVAMTQAYQIPLADIDLHRRAKHRGASRYFPLGHRTTTSRLCRAAAGTAKADISGISGLRRPIFFTFAWSTVASLPAGIGIHR